jgi:hypothetical protein
MRREASAIVGLVLALGWFALGAPQASLRLLDGHAQSTPGLQLPHLTSAVALAAQRSPALLPKGADAKKAADWLEEAALVEEARHDWAHRGASVLSASQLEMARSSPLDLPARSRQWPATPALLVALILEISERYGSELNPTPPEPTHRPWEGATGEDLERGLLSVVRHSPDLTETQARAILTAAMEGMRAHEVQAKRIQDVARVLGPAMLEELPREMIQNMVPDRQTAVAKVAISLLRERAD